MADLLTTRQVQDILQVDRTTIYRLVDGGRLPAIRVGKQWRFDRAETERWLHSQAVLPASNAAAAIAAAAVTAAAPPTAVARPAGHLSELLPLQCSQMIQDAFADALGVMIVVTDMQGQPVTQVSNACGLYNAVMGDQAAIARCIANWQKLAGAAMLEPRFAPSDLELLCARGLIRGGNELKGMVFVGGIAPDAWPPTAAQIAAIAEHFGLEPDYIAANIEAVHRLDKAGRDKVLQFVQRIADIFAHILEDRNALYSRLQAIASLTAL